MTDIKQFKPDDVYFESLLQRLTQMLNQKYTGKLLPPDLQKSAHEKQSLGQQGEAFTQLSNLLYGQCVENIQRKNYLIVFNSIWSLFEQIIVELILMAESRLFLLKNDNSSKEPFNTPLIRFVGQKRQELEKQEPEPLLCRLLDLEIIREEEYKDLKTIKEFVRHTAAHTKIARFISGRIASGALPKSIPVFQSQGTESMEKIIKAGVMDENTKVIMVEPGHEMLFQTAYENAVAEITPVLLGYYYDFVASKGSFFHL